MDYGFLIRSFLCKQMKISGEIHFFQIELKLKLFRTI